jgi:Na+/proline symporter
VLYALLVVFAGVILLFSPPYRDGLSIFDGNTLEKFPYSIAALIGETLQGLLIVRQ